MSTSRNTCKTRVLYATLLVSSLATAVGALSATASPSVFQELTDNCSPYMYEHLDLNFERLQATNAGGDLPPSKLARYKAVETQRDRCFSHWYTEVWGQEINEDHPPTFQVRVSLGSLGRIAEFEVTVKPTESVATQTSSCGPEPSQYGLLQQSIPPPSSGIQRYYDL